MLDRVSLSFRTERREVQALSDISLCVAEGEFIALLVPTGCGKENKTVAIDYRFAEGRYETLPLLAADLVRRQAAVIVAAPNTNAARAAIAASGGIPIVFNVSDDPVKLGLVASLARPGGNATGVNFFAYEVTAKQLGLLQELVPKAARIAVLINPKTAFNVETTLQAVQEAARALRLEIQLLEASTADEIDAAFAVLARGRADALFIQADGFYGTRRVQLATLAMRERMPASNVSREMVEAGLLMSYGTSITDMFRQVGIYTGSILKGAKPADLPVIQSTKFEFVINARTAKALGIELSPLLLTRADEVIE